MPLNETEYADEVRAQTKHLADAINNMGGTPLDHVDDVLDAHDWFHDPEPLDACSLGKIVGKFDTFGGDITQYGDPSTLLDSTNFDEVLQHMAYAQFEADVLTAYENGDY